MKLQEDFRIKEHRGAFIVQRKFRDTNWYSNKVTESWESVNIYGGRIDWDRYGYMIMLNEFKSLEKARTWVKEFIKEPIYRKI
ncbi:MAG: hypothetical protein HQ541_17965 [Mariniphaga sp.]|nr:hypothetical protein [Mariniphaga sp.]